MHNVGEICKALCQSVIIQFKIGIINNEIVILLKKRNVKKKNKDDLFASKASPISNRRVPAVTLLILKIFHTLELLRRF